MPEADCIFCKVVSGAIPATVVKRDPHFVAFKDINAQAPTHLLVIPTEHITSLDQARDDAMLGRLLGFARELARDVGIAERGYRVVVNTKADGGQTVHHLHLHVLGGRFMTWPPG